MARDEQRKAADTGQVTLLVCVECGKEYFFEDDETPPDDLTCEKCGNEVFRTFQDNATPDDVQTDFRDSTERDLRTDDAEGEATRSDLHDLNNP